MRPVFCSLAPQTPFSRECFSSKVDEHPPMNQPTQTAENILGKTLREGRVKLNDLRAVQHRRERSAHLTQRAQIFMHEHFLERIFNATEQMSPPARAAAGRISTAAPNHGTDGRNRFPSRACARGESIAGARSLRTKMNLRRFIGYTKGIPVSERGAPQEQRTVFAGEGIVRI